MTATKKAETVAEQTAKEGKNAATTCSTKKLAKSATMAITRQMISAEKIA